MYLRTKGKSPDDVSAEPLTGNPHGLMCEMSCETPVLLFINCTCSSSVLKIAPYESAFAYPPIAKALDIGEIWYLSPIPASKDVLGTAVLKSLNNSYIVSSCSGSEYRHSTLAISCDTLRKESSGVLSHRFPLLSFRAILDNQRFTASVLSLKCFIACS